MSRVAQSDFVADYAAKRAAQMERAKMLREMRKTETSSRQPANTTFGAPAPLPATKQQVPPVQQQLSYDEPPEEPDTQYAPNSGRYSNAVGGTAGGYGGSSASAGYPPRMSQAQPTRVSTQQPPSQQQQSHMSHQLPPPPTMSLPGNNGAPDCIEVSQEDFQRAVAMGIISADQSRQLWGILHTGTPPTVMGTQKPGHQSSAPGFNSRQSSSAAYDEQPGGYGDDGGFDDVPVGRGAGQAPQTYDDSGYTASAYAPPRESTHTTKAQAAKKKSSRPQWNLDTEVKHEEQTMPAIEPKPQPKKVSQQKPRQDWNSDFADENVIAREPPQVGHKKTAAKKTTTATRQREPQPEAMDYYEGSAMNSRQQGTKPVSAAAGGAKGVPLSLRSQQAKPTSAPPPPEQSRDEVEDFLRQKQEAAARLEAELSEQTVEPMTECGICGRRFRESIIDRHENACAKANKKRREFNTAAQRADGVEGLKEAQRSAARAPSKKSQAKQQASAMPANKMPKWKIQSQQLQAAMSAMRHDNDSGGGAPGYVPEPIDDRTPCPHCGRKFAHEVAERHIPKCKTTQAKPSMLLRKR